MFEWNTERMVVPTVDEDDFGHVTVMTMEYDGLIPSSNQVMKLIGMMTLTSRTIVDAPQVVCPLALGHSEHGSKVTQTYVAEGTSGFLLGKGVFSGNTTINE